MKNILLLAFLILNCSPLFTQTTLKIANGNLKITGDVKLVLKNTKLINNAAVNATDGTVTLTGNASESNSSIEGSNSSNFYNLTIDKTTNNAKLGISTNVSNELDLQSGLLDINNFDLDFSSSGFATIISGQTYIYTSGTGAVIREIQNGNSANFTVGDGSCTPITIQNNGTSDDYAVRAVAEVLADGTSGNAFTTGVVNRTWHIEEAVVGGSDLTLTAQWSAADELSGFDRTACYISHYQNGWDLPISGNAAGSNPFQISRNGITSLSPFAVASGTILPVELLSFRAFLENEEVKLEWQTAIEINNSHFEIEHSLDGHLFEKIGEVEAVEIVEAINFYDFLHQHPVSGLNYYRLKQVDLDGRFEYSDIEVVDLDIPNLKDLEYLGLFYPNPASDKIFFRFPENGDFEVQVLDELGRIVLEKMNPNYLNVNELVIGVYFVKMVDLKNGQQFSKSLIITR